MDANDPTDLSLSEAARRIAEGTLTPSALLEACLGRIAATDDAVHAWVSVDEAGARAPPPAGTQEGRGGPRRAAPPRHPGPAQGHLLLAGQNHPPPPAAPPLPAGPPQRPS